jgi:hypothetical protein
MGPSRANPLTGELLTPTSSSTPAWSATGRRSTACRPRALRTATCPGAEEPISRIRDGRLGLGLGDPLEHIRKANGVSWDDRGDGRRWAIEQGACRCGPCMSSQLGLAAMAFETRGLLKPGEKVPEELIQQAIKEVTMHEVGHTLGLRHNFKASTMLKNDQLHDTKLTEKRALSAP